MNNNKDMNNNKIQNETQWKTYVPPNMRKRRNKKNSLHKINSNNLEEFPDLTPKSFDTSSEKNIKSTLDFSALIRDDIVPTPDEIEPGFVKIRRDNLTSKTIIEGNVILKNTPHQNVIDNVQSKGLSSSQEKQLEKLVLRWQTYRDSMDEKYGQQSQFYGMKRLTDPLSESDYESEIESENSQEDDFVMSDEYDY